MAKDWVCWPCIGFGDRGLGLSPRIGFGGQASGAVAKDMMFGGQGLGIWWPRIRYLVAKDIMFGGQGYYVWWPRIRYLVAKDWVSWPRIGLGG